MCSGVQLGAEQTRLDILGSFLIGLGVREHARMCRMSSVSFANPSLRIEAHSIQGRISNAYR